MLTFRFSGSQGVMTQPEVLTSGMVGKQLLLEFSPEWDALSKTVVFSNGSVTRDVIWTGNPVTIPAKVLEKPLKSLSVGVFGISADGKLVIPTVRAEGPEILPGIDPSGDAGVDPSLPVWAQLQTLIGSVVNLQTEAKENLVAAVNELVGRIGEGGLTGQNGVVYIPAVSQEGVLKWSNNGNLPNPAPVCLMGPEGPAGADGKDGEDGKDGYTPVRGTDYWTDADKDEIKAYVDDVILGGAW